MSPIRPIHPSDKTAALYAAQSGKMSRTSSRGPRSAILMVKRVGQIIVNDLGLKRTHVEQPFPIAQPWPRRAERARLLFSILRSRGCYWVSLFTGCATQSFSPTSRGLPLKCISTERKIMLTYKGCIDDETDEMEYLCITLWATQIR